MDRNLLLLTLFIWTNVDTLWAQDLNWVQTHVGTSSFVVSGTVIDGSQNMIQVGSFSQTYDFDPGPAVQNFTSTGGPDAYIRKLDSLGNLVWVKTFSADAILDTRVDQWNNIYLVGKNQTLSADFDPGPGVYTPPNMSSLDHFVAKLDSNGNFRWAKRFGAGSSTWSRIALDEFGGVYVAGEFSATSVDFDPGPGLYTINRVGSSGDKDIYVLKLDTAGLFVWVSAMGSVSDELVLDLEVDRLANVYITGSFFGPLDFDPGPGTFILSPATTNNRNGYVQKLDSSGSLVWAKNFLCSDGLDANTVAIDPTGYTYVGGTFTGLADLDPGPAIANFNALYSTNFFDGYLTKLDAAGQFVWAKSLVGPSMESVDHLALGVNGNLTITGKAYSGADLDPGAGVVLISGTGRPATFVSQLDFDGDYVLSKFFVAYTGDIYPLDIELGSDTSIYLLGAWGTNIDFDPGSNTYILAGGPGTSNRFWGRWKFSGCNSLVCSFDSVANITCLGGSGYASVDVSGGAPPYTYTWSNQPPSMISSATLNTPGIYEVIVRDTNLCSQNRQVLIDGPTYPVGFDLRADLFSGNFRPGFTTTVWIDGQNQGCSAVSGQLQLIYDGQALTLLTANPFPSSISGDTLRWQFSSLNSDSLHLIPELQFRVDSTQPVQSWVCFDLKIIPLSGDLDSTNNESNYCYQVVNGLDPNAKEVFPQGQCIPKYVQFDDAPLTYTIRFQNTGTADAINITILDTVDLRLDINSVRIVGSSFPMVTEVLPGEVLQFHFEGIHLPDSNSNEQLSHGYLIYEISPDSGLPSGTLVRNGSSIFFDFNEPVLTNVVTNTLVDTLPGDYTEVTNIVVCRGDSYQFPDGYVENNIQANLSHLSSFISSVGCDSLILSNISLGNTSSNLTIASCGEYTSPSGSFIWTTSGTFSDTISNGVGCDSVIIIYLTVTDVDTGVIDLGDSLMAIANGTSLQWLDCDNFFAVISGATGQSFVPIQSGTFAVAVNEGGCIDTSSCYSILVTDASTKGKINVTVFPNPNFGEFIIDFGALLSESTVEIYDLSGATVASASIQSDRQLKMALDLKQGMYFLKVQNADGAIAVRRLMVH